MSRNNLTLSEAGVMAARGEHDFLSLSAASIADEDNDTIFALSMQQEEIRGFLRGQNQEGFAIVAACFAFEAEVRRARRAVEDRQYSAAIARMESTDREAARELQSAINALSLQERCDASLAQRLSGQHEQPAARQKRVPSLFALALDLCIDRGINVQQAIDDGTVANLSLQRQRLALPHTTDDFEHVASRQEADDGVEESKANAGDTAAPLANNPTNVLQERLPFREELATCNTCLDRRVRGARYDCGHGACAGCARAFFLLAVQDCTLLPLRCCGQPIDMDLARALLSRAQFERLSQKTAEVTAVNKLYCPVPTCSIFINLDFVDVTESDGHMPCFGCQTLLCLLCKAVGHPGKSCEEAAAARQSMEDGTTQALELARQQGWSRCGRCGRLVELTVGCNHMTCTAACRFEFCYLCEAEWKTCDCPLYDNNRLDLDAEREAQQILDRQGRRVAAGMDAAALEVLVAERRQALLGHDECQHGWSEVNYAAATHCQNCRFPLRVYCYQCDDCGHIVCYTCRFHRMQQ